MKKIEKNSIKYLIIQTLAIIIFAIIIYPLIDLALCKLITHTEFVYSVNEHIIEPIIYGTILGIVFFMIDRKANSKKGE